MSTLTVRSHNVASNKARWPSRARSIARRAKRRHPQALAYVELYNARRAVLTALLLTRYYLVGFKRGKVLYLRRRGAWRRASRVQKWSLGNGKHAIAVRVRHRDSRQYLVIVVAHLSFQHGAAARRREESHKLARLIEGTFPGVPVLILGDFNDARRSSDSRPNDTTYDVLRGYGYHDVELDVPIERRKNRRYSSSHPLTGDPWMRGIHLDRGFGTEEVRAQQWGLAVHDEPYDSDHWSLDLVVRIEETA